MNTESTVKREVDLVYNRECRFKALEYATRLNPANGNYNPMNGQPTSGQPTADNIIKDADKIYEWLTKINN